MFLFPQCHSHNPSPGAEPQARRYNISCVCGCGDECVFMWLHCNIKMKSISENLHACTYNMGVFVFMSVFLFCQCVGTSVCALIMLQIVSSWLVRVSCDWRSIQDPLIPHSVFYQQRSELGAELSKQPAHLGVCYKLLGFVFLGLYIIFHCTSFRSVSCSLGQYLSYNSSDLLSLSLI